MAARSGFAVALVVVAGVALAGCGGGGGGGAPVAVNNPPPPAAKPGNALLLHASGTSAGGVNIDGKSPTKGSTVDIASSGTWTTSAVTGTYPNYVFPSGTPDAVQYDWVHTPSTYNLYKRPVTINVSGGTGGLGASTVSGIEYVVCQSAPTANGCGDKKSYMFTTGATQDAVLKTETLAQNGPTATKRTTTLTQINSLTELTTHGPSGQGALEHSFVGQYSDATLIGTLTNGVFTADSGTVTSGWLFGGDSTAASEMAALKTGLNPTATYTGAFIGNSGSLSSGVSSVFGDVALTADFGGGTIKGDVSNLTMVDTNTAAGYGLSMNGTIAGSAYSGAATYSDGTGTGQVVGGFFGANAAETAGVVQVQGAQPGGTCVTADCFVQGAFGAKKQ